jgi:hypothetical protein
MQCTTISVLRTVLDGSKDTFSSHEFIRDLMKANPDKYVNDLLSLYEKRTKRPLTTLHGLIGKSLVRFEGELIERLPRTPSRNLLGRLTSNQMWRKIKP